MLRKKLAQAVLIYGALHGEMASAVGVGEIALASSLNQPFRAFIPLREAKGIEPNQLKVELASREAYENAGVDRTQFLTTLQFYVEVGADGRGRIVVTTPQPVVEPYLDFILEVRWPNGRMLREYTVLLDLPEFQADTSVSPARRAQPLVNETVVSQAVRREAESGPMPTAVQSEPGGSRGAVKVTRPPVPAPGLRPRPEAEKTSLPSAPGVGKYRIQHHDTMWQIASELRPSASVSTEQTMIALLRKNPDAFIGNNVNRVKSGYLLQIPSEEEVNRVAHSEAIREIKQQARDWRNKRISARSGDAAATSKPASAPQLDATKTADSPQSDESAEVSARFSIGSAGDSAASEELNALSRKLREEQELREKLQLENASITSRVVEMEKQIDTLNKLIALKNRELAALQSGLAARNSNEQNGGNQEQLNEEIARIEQGLAQDVAALEQRKAEKANLEGQGGAADPSAALAESGQSADAIAMAKEIAEQSPQGTAAAGSEGGAADKQASTPVAEQATPRQPAWYESELLKYVAAGLAVLGLLFLALRRRAAKDENEAEPTVAESASAAVPGDDSSAFDDLDLDFKEDTAESPPSAGEPDTESDAFGTVSEFDFASLDESFDEESGLDLDAADWEGNKTSGKPSDEEPVEAQTSDVISEAEIYVAYGRYDQAASLLKNAIVKDPKNVDLQVKLIDVYLDTRDKENFQETFQLLQQTGDQDAIARVKESMSAIEGVSDWLSPDDAASASDTSLDALDDELSFLDDDLSGSLGDDDVVAKDSSVDAEKVSSEERAVQDEAAAVEGLGEGFSDFDIDLDIDLDESASEPAGDGGAAEVQPEDARGGDAGSASRVGDLEIADFELELDDLDSEIAALDSIESVESGSGDTAGDKLDEFSTSLEEFSFDSDETTAEKSADETSLDSADTLGEFDLASDDSFSLDELSTSAEDRGSSEAAVEGEAGEFSLDELSLDDMSFDELSGEEKLSKETAAASDNDAGGAVDAGSMSSPAGEDLAEPNDAVELSQVDDLDSALAELDAEVASFDVEPSPESTASEEEKADQELDSLIDAADRDADSDTNSDLAEAAGAGEEQGIDLDDLVFDEFDASAEDDIGMLSDGDDVATKLDLARAYVELGDTDGAREMLEEVIQEGSEQQRGDAEELLKQLS